jgi:hypothetical protein
MNHQQTTAIRDSKDAGRPLKQRRKHICRYRSLVAEMAETRIREKDEGLTKLKKNQPFNVLHF